MPSGIWRGDFTTTNCGREDPALQALSLAAMIPIGGQAATASKLAGKVGEPLLKNMDKADEVAGFLGRYKDELAEACEELACFPAGTPVLTPLGYVPIEQLRKGDFILSRPEDDVNAPVTHQKVEVAYIREAEVLELTIGGRSITTTAEHPFWVRGFGWTPAAALEADDELATADGSWIRLDTIRYTGRHTTVFNIRVQEDHTYFVGSPEWGFAVWVHNTHIDPTTGKEFIDDIAGAADEVIPSRQLGDRMTSADDALKQLEEIERAQRAVRQGKSRQIIDSIEKSRQRAKNQLRDIANDPDLLDEFF